MTATPRKRIAIMQPYFFPYAGYFRLFAQADEFVILDCVQFPRTGRVHRSEIARDRSGPRWLTLPLARQPRNVLIRELEFAAGAQEEWKRRLAALPALARAASPDSETLHAYLHSPLGGVLDFLQDGLRLCCSMFGLNTRISQSSSLGIPDELRGQDRILAICRELGASHYLNAPGGRDLYEAGAFRRAGIELEFLPPYSGEFRHLLPCLLQTGAQPIAEELAAHPRGETA